MSEELRNEVCQVLLGYKQVWNVYALNVILNLAQCHLHVLNNGYRKFYFYRSRLNIILVFWVNFWSCRHCLFSACECEWHYPVVLLYPYIFDKIIHLDHCFVLPFFMTTLVVDLWRLKSILLVNVLNGFRSAKLKIYIIYYVWRVNSACLSTLVFK